jgi:type I restriction enzyme, S subunit
MRNWQRRKIAEIAEVITGRTPPSTNPEYFGDRYPFITPTDMDGRRLILSTDRYLSEAGAGLLHRIKIPKNSICVSCIGWQLGKVAIAAEDSFTNQQINTIVPNDSVDSRFVYYALSTKRQLIRNLGAMGVRTPIVNKSTFSSIEIDLPPLDVQRRLSTALSTYDDLIENNERRITVLEEMARRIYTEWFVHFGHPSGIGPRTVSKNFGKIPEGWEDCSLADVLSVLESGSRPKGGIKKGEKGIPSIGAENINGLGNYDYSKDKFVSKAFFDAMRRGRVHSGDVLLYKDGAHIGRKSMFMSGYPHEPCAINEHVFLLRPIDGVASSWLYFFLDTPQTTERIRRLNSNAAQPGINQQSLNGLPVLLPPKCLMRGFHDTVLPILSLLFNLAKANQRLRISRDLLLPRVVSGQLSDDLAMHQEVAAE